HGEAGRGTMFREIRKNESEIFRRLRADAVNALRALHEKRPRARRLQRQARACVPARMVIESPDGQSVEATAGLVVCAMMGGFV
ncbi:hypothetical protein, partial [Bradyrhizobium sp. ORS 375]|uniref:hypothetical protein n=1 Tax=Bradyrhizobium sp. (strain ORS 375) TaxID=566679 RepID=UPI00055074FD